MRIWPYDPQEFAAASAGLLEMIRWGWRLRLEPIRPGSTFRAWLENETRAIEPVHGNEPELALIGLWDRLPLLGVERPAAGVKHTAQDGAN